GGGALPDTGAGSGSGGVALAGAVAPAAAAPGRTGSGQSSSGPLAAGRVTVGGAGGVVVGGVAGPAEAAFLAPAPPPGRPESAWSRASHRNCQVPPSTWCTASSTGSGAAASILAWTPCWN